MGIICAKKLSSLFNNNRFFTNGKGRMSVLDRLPTSITKIVSFRPDFLDSVKENRNEIDPKISEI